MTSETRTLKGTYFQLVETKHFQPRVNLMSTCTALPRETSVAHLSVARARSTRQGSDTSSSDWSHDKDQPLYHSVPVLRDIQSPCPTEHLVPLNPLYTSTTWHGRTRRLCCAMFCARGKAVQVEHIRLTPGLKALGFQPVESTSLSKF